MAIDFNKDFINQLGYPKDIDLERLDLYFTIRVRFRHYTDESHWVGINLIVDTGAFITTIDQQTASLCGYNTLYNDPYQIAMGGDYKL